MEHVHDSDQFLNKRDKSRIVHGVGRSEEFRVHTNWINVRQCQYYDVTCKFTKTIRWCKIGMDWETE